MKKKCGDLGGLFWISLQSDKLQKVNFKMGLMQRVIKPKNQKSKRALEAREPKAIENTKTVLFVRGSKASDTVVKVLKDIQALKKPHVAPEFYGRKNDILPFEDASKLEIFCKKNDSSLFLFGNHNKKRPHNLIIGRTFDGHLLDMVEMGILDTDDPESFKLLSDFDTSIDMGTKPCLLFSGVAFEQDETMKRVQNLLVDFFRGPVVTNIRLAGIQHALQFTAVEEEISGVKRFKILFRSYKINLKKSGTQLPRAELEEIGPRMNLVIRRTHLASSDLFKTACKQVKNIQKVKKVKNITEDGLGTQHGRVHVPAQNIGTLQTRKMKGFKETPEERKLKQLDKIKQKQVKAEKVRKANVEAVFGADDE